MQTFLPTVIAQANRWYLTPTGVRASLDEAGASFEWDEIDNYNPELRPAMQLMFDSIRNRHRTISISGDFLRVSLENRRNPFVLQDVDGKQVYVYKTYGLDLQREDNLLEAHLAVQEVVLARVGLDGSDKYWPCMIGQTVRKVLLNKDTFEAQNPGWRERVEVAKALELPTREAALFILKPTDAVPVILPQTVLENN